MFPSLLNRTNGTQEFAECQIHSAKDILHSAKSLPSVTLGKRHSAKFTLPSVIIRALGKGFAECPDTRQRSHVAPPWSRGLPSVRLGHSAKSPRQGTSTCLVCRVSRQWHSANVQIFAECQYFSTRQSDCAADLCKLLCRVFWLKHSAKW